MTKKAFDLSSMDVQSLADKGAEIEIVHPDTGEGIGIFITVLGQYSKAFVAHQKKSVNEMLLTTQQRRIRNKQEELVTVDKLAKKNVALLIACTVGWRMEGKDTILWEGKELEFNHKNAETIYNSEKVPFVRQQVDEAITDNSNFT